MCVRRKVWAGITSARRVALWMFVGVVTIVVLPYSGSAYSAEDAPAAASTEQAGIAPMSPDAALEFFERRVRPLLIEKCSTCHSADTNSHGGLRVDDRNGLLNGGGRGPAIVPGAADKSLLMQVVKRVEDRPKMPPDDPLDESQIAILTEWINQGAVWTETRLSESLDLRREEYEALRKEHWSWQPLSKPTPPVVQRTDWATSDIDRFVLSKLEQRGLAPVGDASKAILLRRVTFDLTGLPPTPAEYSAFIEDTTSGAFEAVVDRLLSSPHYAERWGRHWLDVARYGESTGSARNLPMPHAWRYRDYVLNAFASDKPFDQFIREQIAGDLLPASSPAQKVEQLVATGFLVLGVKDVNQRFKVRYIMDNVDEQIDSVTRAFLGLTASCARCHDHKFDPIPVTDYYALAGIFRSTEMCDGLRNKMGGGGLDYYDSEKLLTIGLESKPKARAEELASARRELQQAQAELRKVNQSGMAMEKVDGGKTRRQVARERVDEMQQKLLNLSDPAQHGPVAFGVRDAKLVGDTEIRIRGEAEKLGPVVPRGFLGLIPVSRVPEVNPRQSGRLELAEWLVDSTNPLTSRVLVNRVWLHLFGRGIVSTPDNFGTTGDTPSHPELLDHLANSLVNDQWSIRRLIRRIVLSRAYRLDSQVTPEHLAADPDNSLVWRHSPRRMEAEEIRDATLQIAGRLDRTPPEGSPAGDLRVIEIGNNGAEARKLAQFVRESRNRSIYLPLVRTQTPVPLAVWDFAEQGMVTGHRDATTVAPQALYLLNNGFVVEQARHLARELLTNVPDDEGRLRGLWQSAYAREIRPVELARLRGFVDEYERFAEELAPIPDRPDPPAIPLDDTPIGKTASQIPLTGDPTADPRNFRAAAWVSLCQTVFGSAEFLFIQ